MSNFEETNEDQMENEEFMEEDDQESNKKIGAAPIWIISILLHSIVIAALAWIIVEQTRKKDDLIITQKIMEEAEEPLDEKKEIDVIKEKADVVLETDIVLPPQVTNEEVTDHNETPNEMESATAEGSEEAISDSPQVGSGLMGNIGGGGGGGGSFGQRTGGGKRRAVMKGGGSKATESAVDWALWWLANHQEKDGHWDSGKYEGAGTPESDSACTGAALLAFLGAGHTDRAGKWKANVKSAVTWLVGAQRPDGSWDSRNYSNGICTMAMAEAAGMGCGGSEVKKSAEMAVDYLLKEQNTTGCFDYTGPSARDDMSVTGWCIMGLKSAILAGIREKEIKDAFHKCGDYLDTIEGTKDNTSTSKGLAWYSVSGNNQVVGSGAPGGACQAIAMLVRQYLGWERSAPWLEAASDGQISKIPANYESADIYRVYYAFLTLFQQGGKHWTAWNEPVSKMVVGAQRQDGDFKGSWDPNKGSHMEKGGRVLFTAFLCLSLEIYYRYKSVMN